ncbi:MAG TPA: chorismate synthase [Dehalococcoidia bacterium]|nr:chorismate synthase [Dehalococcoidia bacterium]
MACFRFLTAGESHGQGLTVIVEGVPARLPLTEEQIGRDLERRQGGYGRSPRQQIEQDRAQITAGVRHGLTMGSPIAIFIANRDWENWREAMAVEPREAPVSKVTRLRPGHADLPGVMKYGLDDVRPILERSSARETAARVAAGAVARRLLEELGIQVRSHVTAIGGVEAQVQAEPDWQREGPEGRAGWVREVEASPVRCADPDAAQGMITAIDAARDAGDSVGGVFEVWATGVPIGLGSHVHWDRRLDGRLAQALMSVPAVKGVEVGGGFALAALPGSQVHDVIRSRQQWGERPWRRATNWAGGLEGGMTNGEPLVLRCAVKPVPTLRSPLPSADLRTGEGVAAHYERSDICMVPAAGVVGEAMVAIVLADALLEKFGGDSLAETKRSYLSFPGSVDSEGGR